MALTVLALPVPATNGFGTAVDTHLMDPQKSFVLDGTLGPGEVLSVEATEDPAGLIGFTGVVAWTNSNPGDITVNVIAAFMRIKRVFAQSGFTPTASVSAKQTATNVYFNLPVPSIPLGTTGFGTAVDVSAGGNTASFSIHDGAGFGPNEMLVIQGSNDQASWNGIIAFNGKPAVILLQLTFQFLRVQRINASLSAISMLLGTSTPSAGGGGGFPGFGGAPPAIAAAGAAGATGLASDAGHTHQGVAAAVAGTGIGVSAAVGSVTFSNTGVTSNVAGTGISVSGATGAVTITNTGVTSAVAGAGIGVSGATGAVTFTNTGVTSIVAGTNITISGPTGAVTINATGSTGVSTVTAGTAISITGTGANPIINNIGVTSNVAGAGITVSGATGAVTITNAGVTSAIAGTGIGVSGATGAVTFTNTGVTSLVAGAGINVSGATGAVTVSATATSFPGFGGAPPLVASASAAGAAGTAARSDHTHGQDLSVVYAPSLAAGQHSGVFQQTYGAPNATPSILTMTVNQIPFGLASGLLTQQAGLTYIPASDRLTVGVAGVTGGSLIVNASNTGLSIGGGSTVGIYVTDSLAAGASSVAVDDYFFGQAVIGYTNGNLTNLIVGTGPGQQLSLSFEMDRAGAALDALTVQGTSGAVGIADVSFTVGSTAPSIQVLFNAAGNDTFLGVSTVIAAAATHGYPYIPNVTTVPTGAPNAFGGVGAALVYNRALSALYIRDVPNATWQSIAMMGSTAGAGAGAAALTNLPAGFGTTAKWWNFTAFGGQNCVIPFFTNP